jgi:sec-independent protein translocase protein TatA
MRFPARFREEVMPNIGPVEIIIVVVILLLIFGTKRLPEAGRNLGKGMREFKDSVTGKGDKDEPKELTSSSEQPAVTQEQSKERETAGTGT